MYRVQKFSLHTGRDIKVVGYYMSAVVASYWCQKLNQLSDLSHASCTFYVDRA